jgi:hypothetical protein
MSEGLPLGMDPNTGGQKREQITKLNHTPISSLLESEVILSGLRQIFIPFLKLEMFSQNPLV